MGWVCMSLKNLARSVIKSAIDDLSSNKPEEQETAQAFLFDDHTASMLPFWAMLAELQIHKLRKSLKNRGYGEE
jgi:hypothetical protein